MAFDRKIPGDLARSLAGRAREQQQDRRETSSAFRRETFTLPRADAREKAREQINGATRGKRRHHMKALRAQSQGVA